MGSTSFDAVFTQNSNPWKTLASQGVLLRQYDGTGHLSLDNDVAELSGQAPTAVTQSDCQRSQVVLPGAASPLGGGQVVGQGCVYPAAVRALPDREGPVRRAPRPRPVPPLGHRRRRLLHGPRRTADPSEDRPRSTLDRPADRPAGRRADGTTQGGLFAADLLLRRLEDLFRLGATSAIPGSDGKGDLGYAGQAGLVPFGRDVWSRTRPPPSSHVRRPPRPRRLGRARGCSRRPGPVRCCRVRRCWPSAGLLSCATGGARLRLSLPGTTPGGRPWPGPPSADSRTCSSS